MNFALLDDGRRVIVDSSRNQTRVVGGQEFFLPLNYVNVLLEGSWQAVKKSRLKAKEYGSPFMAMRG